MEVGKSGGSTGWRRGQWRQRQVAVHWRPQPREPQSQKRSSPSPVPGVDLRHVRVDSGLHGVLLCPDACLTPLHFCLNPSWFLSQALDFFSCPFVNQKRKRGGWHGLHKKISTTINIQIKIRERRRHLPSWGSSHNRTKGTWGHAFEQSTLWTGSTSVLWVGWVGS